MSQWTTADIPSQRGRTAVVTGTGGLGYEDTLALAGAGADVIIAGRNPGKGADAVTAIRAAVPVRKSDLRNSTSPISAPSPLLRSAWPTSRTASTF